MITTVPTDQAPLYTVPSPAGVTFDVLRIAGEYLVIREDGDIVMADDEIDTVFAAIEDGDLDPPPFDRHAALSAICLPGTQLSDAVAVHLEDAIRAAIDGTDPTDHLDQLLTVLAREHGIR